MFRVLSIYPFNLTTRIALFEGNEEVRRGEIQHDRRELTGFSRILDQWGHRLRALEDLLSEWRIAPEEASLDAVIGPIGLSDNFPGGVYLMSDELSEHIGRAGRYEHATDLSVPLAQALARPRHAKAFAVLSLSGEEFEPISRISGVPGLQFGRMLHALSIKDAVYTASDDLGVAFDDISVVVAHLGRSFSICSHRGGRVCDLSNAYERGPFSPVRSGSLPAAEIIRMAYSGEWSMDGLLEKFCSSGGLQSYMQTESLKETMARSEAGDMYAGLVAKSMAYQIAQEIAAQATALGGKVDAIVLTGGCAGSAAFVEMIWERVSWIRAKLLIYPGRDELQSMANSAYRILMGRENALSYPGVLMRQEVEETGHFEPI